MTDLLTDAAVEAAELEYLACRDIPDALRAFIAYHGGERPCERCEGSGLLLQPGRSGEEMLSDGVWYPKCSVCHGTGKATADRLVLESEARAEMLAEVVAALRHEAEVHGLAGWDERARCIEYIAQWLLEREFGKDGER